MKEEKKYFRSHFKWEMHIWCISIQCMSRKRLTRFYNLSLTKILCLYINLSLDESKATRMKISDFFRQEKYYKQKKFHRLHVWAFWDFVLTSTYCVWIKRKKKTLCACDGEKLSLRIFSLYIFPSYLFKCYKTLWLSSLFKSYRNLVTVDHSRIKNQNIVVGKHHGRFVY